jgi:glycerol-3-phosphate dehydrogenase
MLHADDPRAPRVLTIYGGKLTGYRSTAEKVLARLAPSLPRRRAVASTRELQLTPAD